MDHGTSLLATWTGAKTPPTKALNCLFEDVRWFQRKLGLKIKEDHGRKDVEIGSDVGSKLPDDGTSRPLWSQMFTARGGPESRDDPVTLFGGLEVFSRRKCSADIYSSSNEVEAAFMEVNSLKIPTVRFCK